VWSLMDGAAAALEELETVICGKRQAGTDASKPKTKAKASA
jgi:hypothetical protein